MLLGSMLMELVAFVKLRKGGNVWFTIALMETRPTSFPMGTEKLGRT